MLRGVVLLCAVLLTACAARFDEKFGSAGSSGSAAIGGRAGDQLDAGGQTGAGGGGHGGTAATGGAAAGSGGGSDAGGASGASGAGGQGQAGAADLDAGVKDAGGDAAAAADGGMSDCQQIAIDYSAAVAAAKACQVGAATEQCQIQVSTSLTCPSCKSSVNDDTALRALQRKFDEAGCKPSRICPAIACLNPTNSCTSTSAGDVCR